MKTYLISYDLKIPGRDYQRLYDAIKSYGTWAKINNSTWIVKTNDSAKDIRDYLVKHIDYNDSLFVINITREAAWRNVRASAEWLKKNL